MSQYVCADYTVVKVEPPTPSPLCYKYSCARAHTLLWTNSLLKDISQVRQGEFGLGGGLPYTFVHKCYVFLVVS